MMQTVNIDLRRRQITLALTGIATLGSGCQSIDVAEWTEEVMLHDKQIVTVWRKMRAYSNGFPNASRGRDIDAEFRYAPLGVEWKGTRPSLYDLGPISFDIFDGVPYLVFVGERALCANRSKDAYAAQFLQWSNGRWVEVSQEDFPIDKALVNLSAYYWGIDAEHDYKGLIRWEGKRIVDGWNSDHPDTVKLYLDKHDHFCHHFQTNF
jgi:hypothetical protein